MALETKWRLAVASCMLLALGLAAGCATTTHAGGHHPGVTGSWSKAMTIAAPTQAVVAMSCTSLSFCVAVGGPSGALPRPGYAWIYRGSSWSAADDVDATGAFVAV